MKAFENDDEIEAGVQIEDNIRMLKYIQLINVQVKQIQLAESYIVNCPEIRSWFLNKWRDMILQQEERILPL